MLRCDREINECDPDPCKNGGQCEDGIAKYTCHCTKDFVGTNCEKRLKSTCNDLPCENGATCTDRNANPGEPTFHCECPRGIFFFTHKYETRLFIN